MAPDQPSEHAAIVRHLIQELRHPLSSMESIAHYLTLVLPRTEAKARRQLGRLQDELRHMRWLLADTHNFLSPPPVRLELLDLTEVVSKTFSEWTSTEGAGIVLQLDPNLPPVKLDLQQMQQLLRGLIAVFGRLAAAPGRSLTLSTARSAGEVILAAFSNSLEFAPGDVDALFDPLGSRAKPGTGLALANARQIAQSHGARMEAQADPPSRLRISIAFPVAP